MGEAGAAWVEEHLFLQETDAQDGFAVQLLPVKEEQNPTGQIIWAQFCPFLKRGKSSTSPLPLYLCSCNLEKFVGPAEQEQMSGAVVKNEAYS